MVKLFIDNKKDFIRHELLELLYFVIYVVFVVGIFTLFAGFYLGGFERLEVLNINNFYLGYSAIILIGVIATKFVGLLLFGYKNREFEGSVVHDPNQTFLGKFVIFKNPFLLAFFSILVFSALFWVFSSQQIFFNATPTYEQQFTVGADIFFGIYPGSIVETLGAIFLINILGLFLGILAVKGKIPFWLFFILFIIGSTLISGVYGYTLHQFRYGFDEIAVRNVILFWSFGGFITAMSGSMLPFLILHDLNNFYVKLVQSFFGSDVVTFITIAIIGIMLLSFILVYLLIKRKT